MLLEGKECYWKVKVYWKVKSILEGKEYTGR